MHKVKQKVLATKQWVLRLSLKKKILFTTIIIVVGFFVIRFFTSGTKAPQYQTTQVERGLLISSVSASGKVASANSASVTTAASGVVEEIYANNGDTIDAGKPIAKLNLDQGSLQKQAAAYASYISAVNQQKTAEQSKMANDAAMWGKQQTVLDAQNNVDIKNGSTTNPSTKKDYTDLEKQSIESSLVQAHKDFAAAETKYLEADQAISVAKAQVYSAWLEYQQTSAIITAPITGTVNDLSLQIGTIVGGQSQSTSTTTAGSSTSQKIATIKTTGNPMVTVNLSEIDIPKIKAGQRATLTFDAFPDKTFTGHVSSIDTSGTVSSGVTTYATNIMLDDAGTDIYSNMAATANIITNTKDNALIVPSGAVTTQNGESTVRVMKKGVVSVVIVETGVASDTQIEIISGLVEGDTVVTGVTTAGTTGQRTGATSSPFSTSFRPGGGGVQRRN